MSRETFSLKQEPITGHDQLLNMFTKGCRPLDQFSIGLETEKLGVRTGTREAVEYEGPNGIEDLLRAIAKQDNWESVYDSGRVIALSKGGSAITLEPGGQLELSSAQYRDLDGVAQELYDHLKIVRELSKPMGICWLGLGLHPVTPLSRISWVPKARYHIMRQFYSQRAGLSLEMMGRTAATQVNLDYIDEVDARGKMRLGSILGNIVGAMYANSPLDEGQLNGFCSKRMEVWRNTDPARSGMPSFFVDGTFSFERYRDFALDVPMYFIHRNGRYQDRTHQTFREFIQDQQDQAPHWGDWEAHLTTLFPDVRLKNHLEFRTADSGSPDLAIALAAFWVGLLYDSLAQSEALDLLVDIDHVACLMAREQVALRGLQAKLGRYDVLFLARELYTIAQRGLQRVETRWGCQQQHYLAPLGHLLDRGLSPAELMIQRWPVNICEMCL